MKNQSGISLITLVVTMVVMLILIGVVGTYSLENIEKSNDAVSATEFANVRDFTLNMYNKILLEDYEFETKNIKLTPEILYIIADEHLTATDMNNIVDVNSATAIPDEYKYYYIQADQKLFEDPEFTDGNITIQDVKSDYIINFYTSTVIAFSEDSCKVDGLIKGVSEIMALIGA